MKNAFGQILKDLRLSQHITREQLAMDICSTKQLQRIENGDSEPTMSILFEFSAKLHTDLNALFQGYMKNNQSELYEEYYKLDKLIQNYDMQNLRKQLVTMKESDYKNTPYIAEMICYAEALCAYTTDHNYDRADYYIDRALCYCGKRSVEMFTGDETLSELEYCLLNLKANIYGQINKYDKKLDLLEKLLKSIEEKYLIPKHDAFLTTNFIPRFYITLILNIGIGHLQMKEEEKALKFFNKGIKSCFKMNQIDTLASLYDMKARLLYKIGDLDESANTFQTAVILYRDQGAVEYLKSFKKMIETDYDKIKIMY